MKANWFLVMFAHLFYAFTIEEEIKQKTKEINEKGGIVVKS
ncbi:MAG: hypothetical protein U9Q92_03380 [archaeon]|nr:hypothetical protein [archaeon]